MAEIKTIQSLFDALGGARETARIFGVGEAAVRMWKTRKRLPVSMFRQITNVSEARGLVIDEALWPAPRAGIAPEHREAAR